MNIQVLFANRQHKYGSLIKWFRKVWETQYAKNDTVKYLLRGLKFKAVKHCGVSISGASTHGIGDNQMKNQDSLTLFPSAVVLERCKTAMNPESKQTFDPILKKIGELLKVWRIQHGYTRSTLAASLNISKDNLLLWEEGMSMHGDLNAYNILRLQGLLNTTKSRYEHLDLMLADYITVHYKADDASQSNRIEDSHTVSRSEELSGERQSKLGTYLLQSRSA